MKVFIGWSEARSKTVALELHKWLPKVIQAIEPWMSERDIQAGARWPLELADRLQETQFGIIVVTRENLREPWIHFEAGALAKQVKESSVCPYLVDVEKSEVTGPLAQFQCKKADDNETFSLVQGLNFALDAKKLPEEVLRETFERWWPDLKKAVRELPPPLSPAPKRPDRDLLEEILERVRSLSREGGVVRFTTRSPVQKGALERFYRLLDEGAFYQTLREKSGEAAALEAARALAEIVAAEKPTAEVEEAARAFIENRKKLEKPPEGGDDEQE